MLESSLHARTKKQTKIKKNKNHFDRQLQNQFPDLEIRRASVQNIYLCRYVCIFNDLLFQFIYFLRAKPASYLTTVYKRVKKEERMNHMAGRNFRICVFSLRGKKKLTELPFFFPHRLVSLPEVLSVILSAARDSIGSRS